ncbi:cyclic nucleotide-binding domain-containing protein [Desulfolithobacter sp.]
MDTSSAQGGAVHLSPLLQLPLRLYAAVRTVGIYPPANPQVQKSLESLCTCLAELFQEHKKGISIGVSGQKLLVNDLVLPEKDQKRPHIQGTTSLLYRLQIDAITFHPGITGEECNTLIKHLAQGASIQQLSLGSGASLQKLALPHVTINGKRYVALQGDEQVIDKNTVTDIDPGKQAGSKKTGELLARLLDGELEVLEKSTCATALPPHLAVLLNQNQEQEADRLLGQLVRGLYDANGRIRQHSSQALTGAIKFLSLHQDWSRIEKLLPAMEAALDQETTDGATARALVLHLGPFIAHLIDSGRYDQAHDVLRHLHDITVKRPDDGEHFQGALNRVLETIATPSRLEWLAEEYLHQKEQRRKAGRLLSVLGRPAASWLINLLGQSKERSERRLLLALLLEIGPAARDELLERLNQDAPWYLLRNIIRLLGEIGDKPCMGAILPYFAHKDLRVKKEVLVAAGNIAGPGLNDFLLHALQHGPRQLLGTVITLIGETGNDRFVTPLCELLEHNPFTNPSHRDELERKICRAMGRIGSKKAIPALKEILTRRKIPGSPPDKVCETAEIALARIQARNRSGEETSRTAGSAGSSPASEEGIQRREQEIFALAAKGETDKAKKKLVDLVLTCARNQDFTNAERLRDRIYEIDPLALQEIIRTGEIIEQEKAGAISSDHLEVWADLMDELTTEEFSAIYHELEERSFQPEETIVSQGDINDELFFINQGSIRVSYRQNDRELFIKTLSSGDLAGENFFNASFWTVTLTALSPVRLSVLRRKSFARWHEEFPGLESKLQDFYNRFNDIQSLLKKKKLDRRTYRRFELSRKIQVQMIDARGRKLGRAFRGSLCDISRGGLAFLVRISKKENGRLLLGRTMRLSIPTSDSAELMHLTGTVIGVHPFHLPESDYSIHIRFEEDLDQGTLQRILG